MKMQVTSCVRDSEKKCWNVVKYITDDNGSNGHFELHTLTDNAVIGWCEAFRTESVATVTDCLVYSPYMKTSSVQEMQSRKASTTPTSALPSKTLLSAASKLGLEAKYAPTSDDPLAPLRTAVQKGLDYVRQVQQVPGSLGSGSSGGSPVIDSSSTGRVDQPSGMADGTGTVLPSNRRRISAR